MLTPKREAPIRHIEFVSLGPGRALVVLVNEDGSVENRAIDVPVGLPPSAPSRAANFLTAHSQGKTLPEVQKFISAELATLKRDLNDLTAKVVEAGIATWSGSDSAGERTLIVRGQSNLIDDKATLEDLERIRQLFDVLETKKDLLDLLGAAEKGEGVRIFIGSENKLFSLSGSSLVVSPYMNADRKIIGAVGVIGPTRLNYGRIVPIVDYTAQLVGRLLSGERKG